MYSHKPALELSKKKLKTTVTTTTEILVEMYNRLVESSAQKNALMIVGGKYSDQIFF